MTTPDSHPRADSLRIRDRVVAGVDAGITSPHGLIAHGRGEALDYLIGEVTHDFATSAIRQAAHILTHAEHPVISVNGNTAALVPEGFIALSEALNCPLEVNIFHHADARVERIKQHLESHGATNVLTPQPFCIIPYLESDRRHVHPEGIAKADVVLVPLEDGDRAEALVRCGKTVITIDLNPLSRTAQTAHVTIVDNIVRVLPQLVTAVGRDTTAVKGYNNQKLLEQALTQLRSGI